MLGAATHASIALERNENCTYDRSSQIPPSDCANGVPYVWEVDEHHGTCIHGVCVCNEGFTGVSDWINLDGL